MAIPVGWLRMTKCGRQIEGTNIVPFKTPLHFEITEGLPRHHHFTVDDLLRQYPDLGLVIDLTTSTRYYESSVLTPNGVQYKKLICKGFGHLPTADQVTEFITTINDFTRSSPDKLICVHCTHGLNRTGYMICRYLMDTFGWTGRQAIDVFERARGHQIERPTYVKDLTGEDIVIDESAFALLRDSPPRDAVVSDLRETNGSGAIEAL